MIPRSRRASARGRSRMSNRPSNAHSPRPSRISRSSLRVDASCERASSTMARSARTDPGDVGSSATSASRRSATRPSRVFARRWPRRRSRQPLPRTRLPRRWDRSVSDRHRHRLRLSVRLRRRRALPVEKTRARSRRLPVSVRARRRVPDASHPARRGDVGVWTRRARAVERSRRNLRVAGWNPIRRRRRIRWFAAALAARPAVCSARTSAYSERSKFVTASNPRCRTASVSYATAASSSVSYKPIYRYLRPTSCPIAPPTGPSGASSRREICSSPWRIPCSAGAEIRRAPPSPRGPAPRVPGGNRPCRSWWWPRPRDT